MSLFGLKENQKQGNNNQDLYQIGLLFQQFNQISYSKSSQIEDQEVFNSFCGFTGEISKLLRGISQPKIESRLTLDEVLDHSFFNQQNQQISISQFDSVQFKLEDFTFIKNVGQGSFGSCDIFYYNRTHEEAVSETEIEIMRLINHPNVIRLYGSFNDNQYLYLIMEYGNQGDLKHFIQNLKKGTQKINEQQLLLWWSQLISAIYQIHKLNVIHRDIKSENIFIRNNQMKIGDFGISKISNIPENTHIGTLSFMAPEQYWQKPYDKQIDIFSLGLVFYQLLNPNFNINSLSDIQTFFEKILKFQGAEWLLQDIPLHLKNILNWMLKNDPRERATAEQLCQVPLIQKYLQLQNLPGSNNFDYSFQIRRNNSFTAVEQNKFISLTKQYSNVVINKFQDIQKELGTYKKFIQKMLYRYLYYYVDQRINQQKNEQEIEHKRANQYLLYQCRRLIDERYEDSKVNVKFIENGIHLNYKRDILLIITPMISTEQIFEFTQSSYKRVVIISNALLINNHNVLNNKQQCIEIYATTIVNQSELQLNLKNFILVFKKSCENIQVGTSNKNVLILGYDAEKSVKCIQSKITNKTLQKIPIFNLDEFQLPQDVNLLLQMVDLCYKQIIRENIVQNSFW